MEPTNEPCAIAKIAGVKMCDRYRLQYVCNYISEMPTNPYGPGENYSPENSHVLPAMIRFHEAKFNKIQSVTFLGSGNTLREFPFSEDFAKDCIHLMKTYYESGSLNIGVGEDIRILDLAYLVKI